MEGVPARGALPDRDLASFLAFALHFAERQKAIRFPGAIDPAAPAFDVVDERVRVHVEWTRVDGMVDLPHALGEAAARVADDNAPCIAAVDLLDSEASEFEAEHALYGEVELLAHRQRAPPSRDPRIELARERGWTETLREHNLLPGRSLAIPDAKHGWFLRAPEAVHLAGVTFLLPSGHVTIELNPFVRESVNDSELQYWLSWGRGATGASEWRAFPLTGPRRDDPRP